MRTRHVDRAEVRNVVDKRHLLLSANGPAGRASEVVRVFNVAPASNPRQLFVYVVSFITMSVYVCNRSVPLPAEHSGQKGGGGG